MPLIDSRDTHPLAPKYRPFWHSRGSGALPSGEWAAAETKPRTVHLSPAQRNILYTIRVSTALRELDFLLPESVILRRALSIGLTALQQEAREEAQK